ncbi:MAG: ring-cleaving dioxygenase [Halofilum sp. (in: g-proteobacteria)]|nr:ring-cleaving dioxygenase [Halofilum sp. (in: g-proteobacteria)]
MRPEGMHHLTAVTAQASENLRFYTETLGMRLVKKTVNQDDTSAYHLFYGDGAGSPGSDLTFFDFPAARERRGTHCISRTGLRVAGPDTLDWWWSRFAELDVAHEPVVERHGRATLEFEDPEGQRLALVDDGGAGAAHPWERSPVPADYQIRGLGPVTLSVPRLEPTERVLLTVLGMEKSGEYPVPGSDRDTTHVYSMGAGGPAAELHVAVQPELPPVRPGAGGVHHVAFRIADDDYEQWARQLAPLPLPQSGPVDRFYFRSLYFREPNGILFELATESPGFTADEPLESLGEKLSLPPFLEPRRATIEARLKPL